MRRRRTIIIVASVLAIAAAISLAVYLRGKAAPEVARLLPEGDAFIYINLKPLHGPLEKKHPKTMDPDYAEFVKETGFQFERDLDEAAFAIHMPLPTDAGTPPAYPYPRFSEVFVGHFNTDKVTTYFRKIASNVEHYREVEIFSVPLQGRTLRVALLGVGIAAASNTEGPQVIHGMIDRYKESALPFGGPFLVRKYYHDVPFASVAWSIGRVRPSQPGQSSGLPLLPGGFDFPFPGGTVIVGSVRWAGNVHVKAEAFASNEAEAKNITDQANTVLNLYRNTSTLQLQAADPDVKGFIDSLKVEQEKDRAVLTATVPENFLNKMLEEPPVGEAPLIQEEQPKQPQKSAPRTKKH